MAKKELILNRDLPAGVGYVRGPRDRQAHLVLSPRDFRDAAYLVTRCGRQRTTRAGSQVFADPPPAVSVCPECLTDSCE
jgi:hypothetical protein